MPADLKLTVGSDGAIRADTRRLQALAGAFSERLGGLVGRSVRKSTPKKSGKLRRSWSPADLHRNRITFQNSQPYAQAVNRGKREPPGRIFSKANRRVRRGVNRAFDRALKDVGLPR